VLSRKISRRTFIKASALTGAGLAVLGPIELESQLAEASQPASSYEYLPNICTLCVNGCGIKVKVKKTGNVSRAVKIEGNPEHPFNRGKLCARGQAGLRRVYDPQRITQPLIRVEGSRRGEWKFRAASWEEAYGYIQKKMQQEKIQPYEVAAVGGWMSCAYYRPYLVAFGLAMGMPNIVGTPMQHCVLGEHYGIDTVLGTFNVHDEIVADYENARFILSIGSNAAVAAISTGRAWRFARAKKRGAKVVTLDPRLSEMAARSDLWLPIKPGTDLAFLLAVLKIILDEKLYDRDFVVQHTNLPFLAYEENGFVRLALDWDEKTGRPMRFYVYDLLTNSPQPVAASSNTNQIGLKGEPLQPALEVPAGLSWQGRTVRPVFEFLRDRVREFTPEWAAAITDLPAAQIRNVARDFGTLRPALIEPGWHDPRYAASPMLRRVAAMLQALVGGIDRKGGWIFVGGLHEATAHFYEALRENKPIVPIKVPGILGPKGMLDNFFSNPGFWPHQHPSVSYAWSENQWQAGKTGVAFPLFVDAGYKESVAGQVQWGGQPYQLKMFILDQSNMIRNFFSAADWKEMLASPNVKLVVAIDIAPNDTTPYADVILPDQAYLEKEDPFFETGMSHDLAQHTRFPAIPAPGQTKHVLDIFFEMAAGFGLDFPGTLAKLWGWNPDDFRNRIQKALQAGQSPVKTLRNYMAESLAQKAGLSVAELEHHLKEHGLWLEEKAEELLAKYGIPHRIPAPTPTGRLEFYSLLLADFTRRYGYRPNWDPILAYIPSQPKASPAAELAKDEFYFTYGKIPTQSHTSTANNDLLLALSERFKGPYFGIWIHPDSAQRLGLKTNDEVEITNQVSGQKAKGRLFVTEMTRPDTLFVSAAFGVENPLLTFAYGKGTALSNLVANRPEPLVGAFRTGEFTVRLRKL